MPLSTITGILAANTPWRLVHYVSDHEFYLGRAGRMPVWRGSDGTRAEGFLFSSIADLQVAMRNGNPPAQTEKKHAPTVTVALRPSLLSGVGPQFVLERREAEVERIGGTAPAVDAAQLHQQLQQRNARKRAYAAQAYTRARFVPPTMGFGCFDVYLWPDVGVMQVMVKLFWQLGYDWADYSPLSGRWGVDAGSVLQRYAATLRQEVQNQWNGRACLVCERWPDLPPLRIQFNVTQATTAAEAHFTVNVVDRAAGKGERTYVNDEARTAHFYQNDFVRNAKGYVTVAHEFGHMLGLPDMYEKSAATTVEQLLVSGALNLEAEERLVAATPVLRAAMEQRMAGLDPGRAARLTGEGRSHWIAEFVRMVREIVTEVARRADTLKALHGDGAEAEAVRQVAAERGLDAATVQRFYVTYGKGKPGAGPWGVNVCVDPVAYLDARREDLARQQSSLLELCRRARLPIVPGFGGEARTLMDCGGNVLPLYNFVTLWECAGVITQTAGLRPGDWVLQPAR